MNFHVDVMSSKYFIILMIPLFLVSPTVFSFKTSGHVLNNFKYNVNEKQNLGADSKDNNEVDAFLLTSFEDLESDVDIDFEPKTSCGKLTCENAPDYPTIEMQRIYGELYPDELGEEESSEIHIFDLVKAMNKKCPPNTVLCRRFDIGFRPYEQVDCEDRIQKIRPKEAVDDNNQRVFLITKQPYENHGPVGIDCMADEYCEDSKTPSGRIWHCKTKVKWMQMPVIDAETKAKRVAKVRITDGCDCRRIKKEV